MARTVNQWRSEVERELESLGVRKLRWGYTGGTHQRVTGNITIKGGREIEVSMTCALSPSDWRAIHRVRQSAKKMLAAARTHHKEKVA